ncbi:LacI family transcriptional regulator [Acetobacteraceae bacterium KSS8]|uniref:LacI family transcriptional regulator n=1 Tax=Endosaccharibacter trunci TaxID=2812733 RepID=A0ABT1W3X8_9PROT|nr:LacI family transcriptional regulator [Acetobacteraceae bacterium KSS8]
MSDRSKPTPALTIIEIARLAGVSKSTVSRVMLGSPLVNAETRRRVEETVAKYDYTPNVNAGQMRSKRTNVVSVIVPLYHDADQSISDPFFMRMLTALSEVLTARNCDLLLSCMSETARRQIDHAVRAKRADGIIVIGQSNIHEAICAVARRAVPIVAWGQAVPDQPYATVSSDNRTGARKAVSHLLGLGRRRIVVLGNIDLPETRPRLLGYRDALGEAGVASDPALFVPSSFNRSSASAAVTAFLAGGTSFDGVFALSDEMGRGAVDALARAGMAVPDDVAVVGFDDIASSTADLPLTTVRQDIPAAAAALVELLMEQIDGAPSRDVLLPTVLVRRQSTGF